MKRITINIFWTKISYIWLMYDILFMASYHKTLKALMMFTISSLSPSSNVPLVYS